MERKKRSEMSGVTRRCKIENYGKIPRMTRVLLVVMHGWLSKTVRLRRRRMFGEYLAPSSNHMMDGRSLAYLFAILERGGMPTKKMLFC